MGERLDQDVTTPPQRRFDPGGVLIGFLAGVLLGGGFALLHLIAIGATPQSDVYSGWLEAFLVWLGAVIRDFTPWASILVVILLIKPARDKFVHLLEGFTSFLGEMVNRLQNDDTIDLWGARFTRAGRRLFQESEEDWTNTLAELIRFRNRNLDNRAKKASEKYKLDERIRRFADDIVFSCLDDRHDWINLSSPRLALHLTHPHFEESLYQLTEYYYPIGTSHGKRGRRFSIRAGIAGRAFRANQFEYDPNVDLDPDDLIPKWGFTREEAARYGRGRCTHFAYPIWDELGSPICVLFFDAPPIEALTGDRGQLEDKIHLGLKQSGLQAAIRDVHQQFVGDPPLIIPSRNR